jgi:hypothetical protein
MEAEVKAFELGSYGAPRRWPSTSRAGALRPRRQIRFETFAMQRIRGAIID